MKIRLDDRNACIFRLVRIHEIEKTLPAPNQIQNLCSSHAPCIRTPPVGAREIREEIFYGLTYSSMIRRLLRTRNTKKKNLTRKKERVSNDSPPPPSPVNLPPLTAEHALKFITARIQGRRGHLRPNKYIPICGGIRLKITNFCSISVRRLYLIDVL